MWTCRLFVAQNHGVCVKLCCVEWTCGGRRALRVNELESSLLWWSWGGLKATTCAPCLTWNSLGQFHVKGFSSAEGGLNIWSPSLSLSSWASLAPLHKVSPLHTHYSLLPSLSYISSPSLPPLHTFLVSTSPSPLLFFEVEWTRGMRVTGTWMGGEMG